MEIRSGNKKKTNLVFHVVFMAIFCPVSELTLNKLVTCCMELAG